MYNSECEQMDAPQEQQINHLSDHNHQASDNVSLKSVSFASNNIKDPKLVQYEFDLATTLNLNALYIDKKAAQDAYELNETSTSFNIYELACNSYNLAMKEAFKVKFGGINAQSAGSINSSNTTRQISSIHSSPSVKSILKSESLEHNNAKLSAVPEGTNTTEDAEDSKSVMSAASKSSAASKCTEADYFNFKFETISLDEEMRKLTAVDKRLMKSIAGPIIKKALIDKILNLKHLLESKPMSMKENGDEDSYVQPKIAEMFTEICVEMNNVLFHGAPNHLLVHTQRQFQTVEYGKRGRGDVAILNTEQVYLDRSAKQNTLALGVIECKKSKGILRSPLRANTRKALAQTAYEMMGEVEVGNIKGDYIGILTSGEAWILIKRISVNGQICWFHSEMVQLRLLTTKNPYITASKELKKVVNMIALFLNNVYKLINSTKNACPPIIRAKDTTTKSNGNSRRPKDNSKDIKPPPTSEGKNHTKSSDAPNRLGGSNSGATNLHSYGFGSSYTYGMNNFFCTSDMIEQLADRLLSSVV